METFPNLDADNLVVFYVVATEKSLTAAAEKLLRSTQPVAKRLLEAYVRVASTDPIAVAIQRTLQRVTSR